MNVKKIEERENKVCLFELQNEELKVIVSNLGWHLFFLSLTEYGRRISRQFEIKSCIQALWK